MFLSVLLMARGGSPMGSCARQTGQRFLSAGTATASAAFRQRLRGLGRDVVSYMLPHELRLHNSNQAAPGCS